MSLPEPETCQPLRSLRLAEGANESLRRANESLRRKVDQLVADLDDTREKLCAAERRIGRFARINLKILEANASICAENTRLSTDLDNALTINRLDAGPYRK
jgi:hypothetical protein